MNTAIENSRVRWTKSEWIKAFDAVSNARLAKGTEEIITFATGAKTDLKASEINEIVEQTFSSDRRRHLKGPKHVVQPSVKEAFEEWRVVQLAKDGSTPPTKTAVETEVPLAAKTAQFVKPAQNFSGARQPQRQPRVSWNDDHWQAVCDELIRRHPITMESSSLIGIKLDDVLFAARTALPDEKIPNINIIDARAILRECVMRAKTRRVEQEMQTRSSPADMLMAGFAGEISKKLLPELRSQLTAAIMTQLRGELPSMIRAMFDELRLSTGVERERRVEQPRQKRIAVIGGYNSMHILQEKLTERYPQFKFTLLGRDPRNIANQIFAHDLVLCNVEGVSHSTFAAAKKAVTPDRFRQISGGESAIYHVLSVFSSTLSTNL